VVWALLDHFRTGKITAVGIATGIVVGLVAITPAAGFVSPVSAMTLGAIAALPSYFALQWRAQSRLDDSLDVFAAHGVGGITGAILTGVFANSAVNGSADGLLFGNPGAVGVQALSVLAVLAFSGGMTFIILKLIGLVVPLRGSPREEGVGMDILNHGEEAYASGDGAILILDEEINGFGAPEGTGASRSHAS
jgi:Amt family ammonium transporter